MIEPSDYAGIATLVVAVVSATGASIAAQYTWRALKAIDANAQAIERVRHNTNSLTEKLIELEKAVSYASGVKAGRAEKDAL